LLLTVVGVGGWERVAANNQADNSGGKKHGLHRSVLQNRANSGGKKNGLHRSVLQNRAPPKEGSKRHSPRRKRAGRVCLDREAQTLRTTGFFAEKILLIR
jgi:hypothetical protein